MNYHTIDETEWDARCLQCGRCCFEKLLDEYDRVIYTKIPCRYLDVVSRRCKVFERRFEICPSCIKLTPTLLPKLNWLPADCGYRTSEPPESSDSLSSSSARRRRGRK